MKLAYLALVISMVLSACGKEEKWKEDPLAWKDLRITSSDGKTTIGLLNCRSLKDENNHYYVGFYIPDPNQYKNYTQITNNDGDIITNFPDVIFHYSLFKREGTSETNQGKYFTKVNIVLTKKLNKTYYYDIIANEETERYFSYNSSSLLNKISRGQLLMKISRTENESKLMVDQENLLLSDSFDCKN